MAELCEQSRQVATSKPTASTGRCDGIAPSAMPDGAAPHWRIASADVHSPEEVSSTRNDAGPGENMEQTLPAQRSCSAARCMMSNCFGTAATQLAVTPRTCIEDHMRSIEFWGGETGLLWTIGLFRTFLNGQSSRADGWTELVGLACQSIVRGAFRSSRGECGCKTSWDECSRFRHGGLTTLCMHEQSGGARTSCLHACLFLQAAYYNEDRDERRS